MTLVQVIGATSSYLFSLTNDFQGVNFLELDSCEVPEELPTVSFAAREPNATLAFGPQSVGIPEDYSTSYVTSNNNLGIHQYPTPQEVFLNEDSSPISEPSLAKLLNNNHYITGLQSSTLKAINSQSEQHYGAAMSFGSNGTHTGCVIDEPQTGVMPKVESPCSSGQSFWAPTPRSEHTSYGPGDHPYLNEETFASAVECLTRKESVDNATAFTSYEDALEWRMKNGQRTQDIDNTVPTAPEQNRALVKVLFKAFKSIAKASDNESMIRPFRQMKHDNPRVEVICWEILNACIQRSTCGPLVAVYDPNKIKNSPTPLTFAERFDYIVRALSTQKTICKHLFDAPFVNTFVDDPVRAKTRVESNRVLNERKGRTMRAGREATQTVSESPKKRRRSMTDDTEGTEVRGTPYLTPVPTHRRRSDRGSSFTSTHGGSSYSAGMTFSSGNPTYTGLYGQHRSVGSSPIQLSSPYLTSSPTSMTRSPMPNQAYSQLRSTSNIPTQSSQGNREMALAYDSTTMPTLNRVLLVFPNVQV